MVFEDDDLKALPEFGEGSEYSLPPMSISGADSDSAPPTLEIVGGDNSDDDDEGGASYQASIASDMESEVSNGSKPIKVSEHISARKKQMTDIGVLDKAGQPSRFCPANCSN